MSEKKLHSLVFIIFFILFYSFFSNGLLVYGDFSTSFSYNNLKFLNTFPYAWVDNSFLGYETSFYSFIRIPYYILVDSVNFIIGPSGYWLVFLFIYFFRYLFFYLFLKELKISTNLSIIISFIYSLNFYFIDRLGHTLISFGSVTIPLLIYSYQKLISKGWEVKNFIYFLFSIIIISSSMHVSLMTIYFLFFVILFNFFNEYNLNRAGDFIKINMTIGLLSILSLSYFILPLFYSSFLGKDMNVINQVASKSSNWIYNLSTNTHVFNTIIGTGFFYSEILNYNSLVILGLVSIVSLLIYLIIYPNKKTNKYFMFYFFTYLFFLFLSSIDLLFPFIPFLKNYLIGFNSIKDNSYFLLYSQFSFWVIVAISIDSFSENRNKISLSLIHLFLVGLLYLCVNIFSFLSFDVFNRTKIPEDYKKISSHLRNDGRVLVLPLGWVSEFKWSEGIMSGFFNLYLADYQIVGQNIIEGPSFTTQKKIDSFNECFKKYCNDLKILAIELGISQIIAFDDAYNTSTNSSIKKDLNFKKNIEDLLSSGLIEVSYKSDTYTIYNLLTREGINKKIISSDLVYKKINPTNYKIKLNNLSEFRDLVFIDSFHSQWKLYLNPISESLDTCVTKSDSSTLFYKIRECESFQNFIEGNELEYLIKNPVFEDSHKVVYDYANQWTIDPEYIKANFDKSYYKQNPDGSIDIELVLYFKPQSYFYLGLIISITTLLICIIYLIYDSIKRRKKSNPNVINLVRNLN